jgi:catechol 2,3-dioxygenase-like lactoylglutathione lyase family enzyme
MHLAHVGLSVRELHRSIDFYREMLGMEVEVEVDFGCEKYDRILDLAGARGRVAVVRNGNVRLELFEFHTPLPAGKDPVYPVSDHGLTHFCLQVTGLATLYERLVGLGVTFHCSPILFRGNIIATYGRDPDGNVFELFEKLDGAGR